MSAYDAIILGGGPSGATAGIILARAGWHVAIVEKSIFPRRKVCGEFVSATSLPLLFELGIGEDFLRLAGPEVRRVGLFANEICPNAPMPRPSGPYGWGRALGREHLDLLLLQAAAQAGVKVWQPWKAVLLERREREWACTLANGGAKGEITAPTVIAANGSWERGPLASPGAGEHRDSDLLAFKAHFKNSELEMDLMPLLVFPGGYGGMVRSDAGRVSLSCCIRRDQLRLCREEGRGRAAERVLDHIEASCGGARDALKCSHLEKGWLSAGPIQPGIRRCYENGVFFVGNLAGEAHPIIAEGISMAMQSSWLLCRELIAIEGRSEADIGKAYTANWRRAFASRIRAAAFFAHLAMRPKAVTALRPFLLRFPQVLTLGAFFAGKAKVVSHAQSAGTSVLIRR
jgi:flavin-dependent dehydrogenase